MHTRLTRRAFGFALGLASILGSLAFPTSARVGTVSTWMGKLYAGDGLDANLASLDAPRGFTADSLCTIYVADSINHVIRRIDGATNIISTYAGSGQYGYANGARRKATFRTPSDVVIGPSDELYITDAQTPFIRKVANGVVSTWLNGFTTPAGIAIDGTTLYISDTGRNRIVRSSTTNPSATVIAKGIPTPGKLAVSGSTLYLVYNGSSALGKIDLSTGAFTPLQTGLKNADGLAIHNGKVYVVFGPNGVFNEIATYAIDTGVWTVIKNKTENEWYNHASDIVFCGSNMRLLFSGGSSIYQADENGANESKIAGEHRWNDLNGLRSQARVGRPWVLTLSPDKRKLYLFANQQLKQVNLKTNTLTTLAGAPQDHYINGVGLAARVSGVTQMAVSPKGTTLYLADRNNNRIRKYVLTTQTMSTLVGSGYINAFNKTKNAYAEGVPCNEIFTLGEPTCAYFDRPSGIALSRDGQTLYVADSDNHRIRTVNVATGKTALLAGTGQAGLKNGPALKARFNRPVSLLLSADGKTLYIVEWGNHAVRAINLISKQVTTLVGNGKAGFRDGLFSSGRLSLPNYLALGPKNILYLSEGGGLRIRTLNLATRRISTLAGNGKSGNQNGVAGVATFSNPRNLVMLNSTTLLVADDSNDMIRAVSLK